MGEIHLKETIASVTKKKHVFEKHAALDRLATRSRRPGRRIDCLLVEILTKNQLITPRCPQDSFSFKFMETKAFYFCLDIWVEHHVISKDSI